MMLKDRFTVATYIEMTVQYYTFAYVWLSCIDTYLFGF